MGTDAGPEITDAFGRIAHVELTGEAIVIWVDGGQALRLSYPCAETLARSLDLHLNLAGVETE